MIIYAVFVAAFGDDPKRDVWGMVGRLVVGLARDIVGQCHFVSPIAEQEFRSRTAVPLFK